MSSVEKSPCCNERLANALTPPPKGRGRRTPLDGRDGLAVVYLVKCRSQTHKSFANQVLNSCTKAIGEKESVEVLR